MSIRLDVGVHDARIVNRLGARWLPDEKTWVIPDSVKNINPFKKWLPVDEGFIVQRPYFVARAKMPCCKCGKETPIIALGAKSYQQLIYETEDNPVWEKSEGPIFFCEIDYLDSGISEFMRDNYPFFRLMYSEALEQDIWGTTCVHCGALQVDDDEYRYEANPLSPITVEDALEIRVIYFKLKFDYYIIAGSSMNTLYDYVIRG